MAITGVIKTVQLPGDSNSYNIEAASAGKLTSPKVISASGDVEWKVSFDGSIDVSSGAVIKSVPWNALTNLTAESGASGIMTPEQIHAAINKQIAGVYQIQGTTAFSALTDTTFSGRQNGYVYNVSSPGKIPFSASHEGSEININAGDNVVWISATPSGWDKLANTLDVSAYVTKSDVITAVPENWSALNSESASNPVSEGRVFSALSSLADEFSNDISALNYSAYTATVENGNLRFSYTDLKLFEKNN